MEISYKIGKYTTKKPSGLTISRNDNRFTFGWKIGDANYGDGQELQWRVNGGTWTAWTNPTNGKKIGKKDTAAYIDLNFSNYFPTTSTKLNTVDFRVRGCREMFQKKVTKKKKTTVTVTTYFVEPSAWETKTYTFKIPSDPKVSASIDLEQSENRTTFTVTEAAPTDAANQSRRVVWQSVLVSNCNYTDGSKATWSSSAAGWQTGTMSASGGSKAIDEAASIAAGTHTRWFRAKAQGVHGDSAKWVYSKHVYAEPNGAKITGLNLKTENLTYDATLKWTASATTARPIDDVTVQYVIGTPQAGMAPPSGSWTDAVTLKDTKSTDGTTVDIPDVCGTDEALFLRVNTRHDNRISYGAYLYADVGDLAAPTDFTASIDSQTHKASFHCVNESDVPDSFIAIRYLLPKNSAVKNTLGSVCVAVVPHGETDISNVSVPTNASTLTFTAQAIVGTYRRLSTGEYEIHDNMRSATVRYGTSVPAPPSSVTVQATSVPGTINVAWAWTWAAATVAELSWADHSDAWYSTDEPNIFEIDHKATNWRIAGLDAGVNWYVRVRLGQVVNDEITYSDYGIPKPIKLSSAPVVPVLQLSAGVITARGSVDASWVYVTSDGTGQSSAKIAEVITSGGTTQYRTIATTTTAQRITISARKQGWTTGTTHLLAVRVTSGSGHLSDDWSAPVPVIVANAVTCTIASTSLETVTETIDGEADTFTALTEMPLEITVTGAKAGGTTSVIIERADEYFLDRPDEEISRGYEGETIAVYSQQGESAITITNDMLIGHLDDGAKYRIIATTQDSYGQSASAEQDFRVRWTDQAIMPTAGAIIDEGATYAIIIPMLPNDVPATSDTENAVADIYRLSVDKPVLIYEGATFGEMYVDPYPTIGEYGGHRIVYRSKNGDYITEENTLAWVDLDEADDDFLDIDYNIIEWDTGVVRLEYNVDLSNSWTKDFTETQYLGGSVQGDWNPAVHREGSLSGVAIATDDAEVIQAMRRLAVHAGICHIRTKDGSNYAADVQVSESYKQGTAHKIVEFSLKITRVDTQALDGMTLAAWEELNPPNWDNFVTDETPYLMRKTGGTIYGD